MGSGASLPHGPTDLTLIDSLDEIMTRHGEEKVNAQWLTTAESAETKEEMTNQLNELLRLSQTLDPNAVTHTKTRFWLQKQITAMKHRIKMLKLCKKSAFATSLQITSIQEEDEEQLERAAMEEDGVDDTASVASVESIDSVASTNSKSSIASDSTDGSWVNRRISRDTHERQMQRLHQELRGHSSFKIGRPQSKDGSTTPRSMW